MNSDNGYLIYKITNTENGKVYIGKTKEYYGATKYGIERRFKTHIINATAYDNKRGCPILCNAIRKYGKDKFNIELIEKTDVEHVDEKEIFYINKYNSTNEEFGYNISLGGKGRHVAYVKEDARKNISKAQRPDGDMNIIPYKDKKTGEIIGYRARRRERDKHYDKYYTSKKFTPEENYKKAHDFIEHIKNIARH